MADLNQILARFGFVTVMKPKFYSLGQSVNEDPIFEIDSLRISNITQEGPSKTVKGGLYGNTQMRYGKTMRLEMEDVVGRIDVLQYLMGAKVVGGGTLDVPVQKIENFTAAGAVDAFLLSFTPDTPPAVKVEKTSAGVTTALTVTTQYTVAGKLITLTSDSTVATGDLITVTYNTEEGVAKVQITDKFAPAYQIMGQTFVIDSVTGNKEWINIYIPQFLPDSIFSQTMESEGDFGAISIAGDILANDCGIFYEFLIEDTPPTNC